jgi:hypothetical protein
MPEFSLNIFARTDAGVACSVTSSSAEAFWLSKKCCEWSVDPQPGARGVRVGVPGWLLRRHRQLAGDVEFEKAKQERRPTMAEQRELSGTLSRNRKRENDKQPEVRGSCTIDGVPHWISAWVKEGQDGKFFSLAFKPKEEKPSRQAVASSQAPAPRRHSDVGIDGPAPARGFDKQLDDEIPF